MMQPKDEAELADMIHSAVAWQKPVMIRYPRGCGPGVELPETSDEIPFGKAEVLTEGEAVQIWALGDMLPLAQRAAKKLQRSGFKTGVVNPRFIVPLDCVLLGRQAEKAQCIVTIENGVVNGGFGSAVCEALNDLRFKGTALRFGWPDKFVPHGSFERLCERFGLTDEVVEDSIIKALDMK
jgi:1-deoxy-D-xylulose-5-phosphate synthase